MGKVNIKRTFSFENMAMPFDVLIDGQKAGEIKHNAEISFELPNGEHTIQFRLQGKFQSKYTSVVKSFTVSDSNPQTNVSCRIWGYGLFFISLAVFEGHIVVNID